MKYKLTKKQSVAGVRTIHALQGGPGMRGKYLRGMTWCGVEHRSKALLVETDAAPTCGLCRRVMESHDRRVARRGGTVSTQNRAAG